MKKLLAILILILTFQTPSQADDIRDFQIEGMSIGDSLLDHFSEEEIKIEKKYQYIYPNSNKFVQLSFESEKFDTFDFVQIHLKNNDNKSKIFSITGVLVFHNNIQACLKKKDAINIEIKELFKNSRYENFGKGKHDADSSGKSFAYDSIYWLSNGNIYIACYDWSEKLTEENRWKDNLKLAIDSKEFEEWLNTEAYP